jgi:DNA-binding MarR family transcriptional regulator
MPKRDLHDRLVRDCHDVAHEVFAAMYRGGSAELLSLDLTMGQFKAMVMITMYGPQAVGEVGRRLGLSEPAASLLVDRLEELALARREHDPRDGRRTLVTATPAAAELAARLREGREDHIVGWLGALDDAQLRGLTSGFRGLLRVAAEAEATGGAATSPKEAPRG